ncbi:unnamed protein product [Victoria cruziana]
MADGHLFNNILLGGRGGANPGQFRVHSGGIVWRKLGGGKAVEVDKSEIVSLMWMKVPKAYQLGVRIKAGLVYKFTGFREQDVNNLSAYMQNKVDITPEEKQMSISGQNWGQVDLNGNMLTFLVGSKQAFEVSVADVSQIHLQGKDDVILEFHLDDTTGANEKDSLMELGFHVPSTNTAFVGDETRPPAQIFQDKIMSMADVGASGEEAVAVFDGVAILTPRGRYYIELHMSFLRLQGQANDFKIQHSSIVRLFQLPKSNQPHVFVIVTLDPPIRKGQTLYPHIVMQFDRDTVTENTLSISENLLKTKYKDRLEASYKGLIADIFIQILKGLSGAKVTRPGKFRSAQAGLAVKSSLKAEDGILYPLEKGFFFLPKPPTLILHDEIEYVEFERHGAGGTVMSSHYFDLLVKLKSEQEHQFRNIQRNEYHNLFDFIRSKGLKILNLGAAQKTGVAAVLDDDDDEAVDPHLERIKIQRDEGGEESDEEDEDFVADKDDSGSPTDDSEAEDTDASEREEDKEKTARKEAKKESVSAKSTPGKRKSRGEGDDGSKKRKQPKKKKDPNAPKRAMSAFMFFSTSERDNVKRTNPGLSFTDVGRALGEKWKKMSGQEKDRYETMARADQKRYKNEMAGYKSGPIHVDSEDEPASD